MSWLVEQGIGEQRAILYEDDRAVAARLHWPGSLAEGQVEDAVLISRTRGSTRGRARFASGEEALVDRLPPEAAEGARLRLEVQRSAMGEARRLKPAQARPSLLAPRPAPDLLKVVGEARAVRHFPVGDWEDIWRQAWDLRVDFPGGTLEFAPTPAMTLIDVDGSLPARALALAAVAPIGRAIELFDLYGSVGIDFPTLPAKADRKAVDAALEQALAFAHERTAMNGFGFVQVVSRSTRPSLLHRLVHDPAGAAARLLLRQGEQVSEPGALLLTCPPQVRDCLREQWLEELGRRTGRDVRVSIDPALALDGGFAQAVPR